MARLILFAAAIAVCVAFAFIMVSTTREVARAGSRALKEGVMGPSGLQKASYIVLIVVLFGVASGWLGGL